MRRPSVSTTFVVALLIPAALCAVGCGGSAATVGKDAAAEQRGDAAADRAALDAGGDAAADGRVPADSHTQADSGADAKLDAKQDVTLDVHKDAPPETGQETAPEAVADVLGETEPETTPDAVEEQAEELPCIPDCTGKECGDDGCGGACGICEIQDECVAGACVCVPACEGKECGDDGCGGECGQCTDGSACALDECVAGMCESPPVVGHCAICGACVPAGSVRGGSPCQTCDPAKDPEGWSYAGDGFPCLPFGPDVQGPKDFQCMAGECCPPPGVQAAICELVDCGPACGVDCGPCAAPAETCIEGKCLTVQGGCADDVDCLDDVHCTYDFCGQDSVCTHIPVETPECCDSHLDCGLGGPWDDGDCCTLDFCQEGTCIHQPSPCAGCWSKPGLLPCDDGNPCTGDVCEGDCYCVNAWIPACCTSSWQCGGIDSGKAYSCNLNGSAGTCTHTAVPCESGK